MTSELKPCPFCGANAKIKNFGNASCVVVCENLHRGITETSKTNAAAAWNTRAAPDVSKSLVRKNDPAHVLYESGDCDAPASIKDSNGDIALGLCKICGAGEIELEEPCCSKGTEVSELERYELHPFEVTYYENGNLCHDGLDVNEVEDPNGKYVLYSEAAAIIAAKDGVQQQWQDIAKHHTGYENPSIAFRVLLERAEAAESKLARKPFGYVKRHPSGCLSNIYSVPLEGYLPIYTAPIASDDDLRVGNERLRQALKDTLMHLKPHVDSNKQHREPYEAALSAYDRGVSALNPSESQK